MQPLRFLLVEDDEVLREMTCDALREHGFDVTTAVDGQDALEVLGRDNSYDIMVLDDTMPRLSGRNLLARLRAEGCRLPAVLVSGSLQLDENECARLGIGPVLRKPCSIADLLAAVREQLRR